MRHALTSLFLALSFLGYTQKYSGGIGYSYASEVEASGVNLRAYYLATHHICFGPEVGIFARHYPNSEDRDHFEQITEYNLNGHYVFELSKSVGAYPLTGLNVTAETIGANGDKETEWFAGANLGAGFHYIHGKLGLLAEYKYVAGELPEQIITAGVFIMLGSKGKSEEHHD